MSGLQMKDQLKLIILILEQASSLMKVENQAMEI